jgi:3-isopropylmalate/(R)-2-methylmalate dehydratase small subunit
MIIEGRAVVIDMDDVNTDVLYPGPYLNVDEPEEMKAFLFEGLDPSLRDLLGGDTVLVVGDNFGGGSSREHVQLAMKAWGVRAVVGKSFARIFFRNCINLALPAVSCAAAAESAHPGSAIRIMPDTGVIEVDGGSFQSSPLPPFIIDMFRTGGLEGWVRRRLEEKASKSR